MSDPIRVLHLVATGFVGGPEKQILTHLRHYDRSRFHITAGSFLEGGPVNDFLGAAAGLDTETLPLRQRLPVDLSLPGALRRQLDRRRIDVLVSHGYKSNVVGRLAGGGRVPQAMYVRGWTNESLRVKAYNRIDKSFLRRAELVVTVAAGKVRELEALGVSRDRIRVVVNAVEPEVLKPSEVSLRERHGLAPETFLLLAAGRLSPEKGHDILIEAMAALRDQDAGVACVVFGDGPVKDVLAETVRRLGLQNTVFLDGFHEGWKAHLPEADALVNPSLSEVMPNVVLESMVHRCPVVATAVGGVGELITDGETGFLVAPGDPAALAAGILESTRAGDAIRGLKERAYASVRERYTFEEQARKLHELYEELYAMRPTTASG